MTASKPTLGKIKNYPRVKPATIDIDGTEYIMLRGVARQTYIGIEDHGIFSLSIDFDFDGGSTGQGLGFRCLGRFEHYEDEDGKHSRQRGTEVASDYIIQLLRVFGVDWWEKIPGKEVWCLKVESEWSSIAGLANIDKPEYNHLIFEPYFDGFAKED